MNSTSAKHAVVLVPTYNESENLAAIVNAILKTAPVDIWILDDNSPDGTGRIADQLASESARVRVSHRPKKLGLGRAYLDGFRLALEQGYERIIEMDADFSHSPDYLPTMLELSKSFDVVLGSRWVEGGGTQNWPAFRKIISKGGSIYARGILGLSVRDLTGGFKCFRREVLQSLDLSAIQSTGYAFQIEVTYRAFRQGFKVKEFPIVFVERRDGASKMSRRIDWEAVWRVPLLRWRVT